VPTNSARPQCNIPPRLRLDTVPGSRVLSRRPIDPAALYSYPLCRHVVHEAATAGLRDARREHPMSACAAPVGSPQLVFSDKPS